MTLNNKAIYLLFIIIVIEGYVVLSSELLAIRLTIPFVGSGTDTVSIIIAAILMPLAFGYYYGGRFKPHHNEKGEYISVRKKLISNITISLFFLIFSISYIPITIFFDMLNGIGLQIRLINITLYALIFLVTPTFLLAQTIPLISNYFSKETLSRITGKMLFFSTIGSFLGAVFSTLVLMAFVGVHNTAILNFILLAVLYFMLERKKSEKTIIKILLITLVGVFLNTDVVLKRLNIVENNKYNTIIVTEIDDKKVISLNHNLSSSFGKNREVLKYAEFIRKRISNYIPEDADPQNILVVGAGGFTISLEDKKNIYDYVDIDSSLKKVTEKYFLEEKLSSNINFFPVPARAYLSNVNKKYDIIILDAFTGGTSIPEHLVTREFFQQVQSNLKDKGLLLINMVIDTDFRDSFSRNFDTTLRSVFPYVNRQVIYDYERLELIKSKTNNVVYSTTKWNNDMNQTIYTDNKNRIFYDKPLD